MKYWIRKRTWWRSQRRGSHKGPKMQWPLWQGQRGGNLSGGPLTVQDWWHLGGRPGRGGPTSTGKVASEASPAGPEMHANRGAVELGEVAARHRDPGRWQAPPERDRRVWDRWGPQAEQQAMGGGIDPRRQAGELLLPHCHRCQCPTRSPGRMPSLMMTKILTGRIVDVEENGYITGVIVGVPGPDTKLEVESSAFTRAVLLVPEMGTACLGVYQGDMTIAILGSPAAAKMPVSSSGPQRKK